MAVKSLAFQNAEVSGSIGFSTTSTALPWLNDSITAMAPADTITGAKFAFAVSAFSGAFPASSAPRADGPTSTLPSKQ